MKFTATDVDGAYLIDVNRIGDERGYFGRLWCEKEMQEKNLVATVKQINVGFSPQQGTLRGLHYQERPRQEVKIVRCTRGRVFDVVLDLRRDSVTYKKWYGTELNPDNGTMLYVPEGCATGYLTLTDDAEIYYLTSDFYSPEAATGVRYDDPAFDIVWPGEARVMSDNDQNWENFKA